MKPLALALLLTLAGCAGLTTPAPDSRQALGGLAGKAASGLLEQPPWPAERTPQITLLMRPAEVDAPLPITPEALNEALGRALLATAEAPLVLDWAPQAIDIGDSDQWLLQISLNAPAPPLRLSDRTLQPYRLQLDLSRPTNGTAHWQWQASGAVDLDALPDGAAP
ncbi:hypothetical protein [Salinicola avicenniae]|uniref:hypothetical protein n=1 Tax=Salinicola avicenniae TaxID=2916836 RepID=UPI002072F451|nr:MULTISPECIES: hypothetical protein [unclassified Salinicola]